MSYCQRCGCYAIHSCKCEPFAVWRADEDRDEAKTVHARDHEHAALLWGAREDEDSAEYSIAGHGEDVEVLVARLCSDEAQRWTVTGEMQPHYSARRVAEVLS